MDKNVWKWHPPLVVSQARGASRKSHSQTLNCIRRDSFAWWISAQQIFHNVHHANMIPSRNVECQDEHMRGCNMEINRNTVCDVLCCTMRGRGWVTDIVVSVLCEHLGGCSSDLQFDRRLDRGPLHRLCHNDRCKRHKIILDTETSNKEITGLSSSHFVTNMKYRLDKAGSFDGDRLTKYKNTWGDWLHAQQQVRLNDITRVQAVLVQNTDACWLFLLLCKRDVNATQKT